VSFLKILSGLAKLKYFPLVLSLILIIPFTLLPIILSSHFPIISDAWAATYYVDATNGRHTNNGTPKLTPGKPSPKSILLILIQEVRFCSKVGDLGRATYRSFYRIRKQSACQ
jgi:hypothetical protein